MTANLDQWLEAGATKTLDMEQMEALAAESKAAWDEYDAKKKLSNEAHAKAEAVDEKILAALKDAGKRAYQAEIGKFTINQTASVRVPSSMTEKEALFTHIESLGHEVFLGLVSVNSQTLNSWYNKEFERAAAEGRADFSIPGIGAPTTRETLMFTAAKKGKT